MSDVVLKPGALRSDRFERVKRLGWFDPDAMAERRVLVVGAGALGNEVMKCLALTGIRRFTLYDMDDIEPSNLARCVFFTPEDAAKGRPKATAVAEGVRRLEPEVEVDVHTVRIEDAGDAPFRDADVVVACVDNVGARLHLNMNSLYHGVPFVDGGTLGMRGRVQVVTDPEEACLECNVNKSHRKVLDQRFSCTGNDVTFFEPKLAAEITTTSVVAAIEARETIKLLHGFNANILKGVLLYDGMTGTSDVLEVDRNPACPHHRYAGKASGGTG